MVIDIRNENVLLVLLRMFLMAILSLFILIVCVIIEIFSGAWISRKKVTKSKISRIRNITRFKIWINRKFPNTCQYLGFGEKYKYKI